MPTMLVNMIPQSLSGETHQDSEPNLAVSTTNPNVLVATAFSPSPTGSANAPVYVSTNGGATWTLISIVPGGNGFTGTDDITVRFGSSLFAGCLRGDDLALNADRTTDLTGTTAMTVLESRSNVDQPFVQVKTVAAGAGAGKDKVFVGLNDFSAPGGKTATIDVSQDGSSATATFTSDRIDDRATSGQDGPQVRTAVHADGTVYAAFYGWRSFVGGVVTTDVVVVRDDAWGASAPPVLGAHRAAASSRRRHSRHPGCPRRVVHMGGADRPGTHRR
jgi:hypothetical protein